MSRFYDALREAGRSAEAPRSDGIPRDVESSAETPVITPLVQRLDAAVDGQSAAVAQPAPVLVVDGAEAEKPGMNGVNGSELHSGAAVTGSLPLHFDAAAKVLPNSVKPVVLEQYRRLRTKILQEHAIRPFKTLVIASPGPQEGKTVTALNLGLSFSMLPNFRVLIVDGDLRRGTIGDYVGARDCPGLGNVIEGSVRLEDAILESADLAVDVLPSGNAKKSAAELLSYEGVERSFRRMGELYDLVIVDSPPVNLVTDTQIIASKCDAVLLVARAFLTKRKALEKAMQDLASTRVIGSIFNSGTSAQVYRQYGGYYDKKY